jgi:hypothetical protein
MEATAVGGKTRKHERFDKTTVSSVLFKGLPFRSSFIFFSSLSLHFISFSFLGLFIRQGHGG